MMIEDLLRRVDRIAAPDLWPEVEAGATRELPSRRGSPLLVGAAAIAVAVLGLAVAVSGFLGGEGNPRGGDARTVTPGPIPIEPRVAAKIPVGAFPQEVAVGEGAVWVTVNDDAEPGLWYVARVDPQTQEVTDRIDVPEVADVSVGEGAVWAVGGTFDEGSTVYRIDPDTSEVVGTIPLGCGDRCYGTQLTVGSGSVWVTASGRDPDFGYVIRIDPSTERVESSVSVPGHPRDLVVGDPDLWVYALTHYGGGAVQGGTIYRIDATTGARVATVLEGRVPPLAGVNGPNVLAYGHGFLWTSVNRTPHGSSASVSSEIDVVRIDPSTNDLAGSPIPLPPDAWFQPFSSDLGAVWFTGKAEGTGPDIYRIDPGTLRIEPVVASESTVIDGAIDPDAETIWVTDYRRFVTRIDLR